MIDALDLWRAIFTDKCGCTPLHWTVFQNAVDTAALLTEKGADAGAAIIYVSRLYLLHSIDLLYTYMIALHLNQ